MANRRRIYIYCDTAHTSYTLRSRKSLSLFKLNLHKFGTEKNRKEPKRTEKNRKEQKRTEKNRK